MALSVKSLPWREVWTEPRAVLLRVRGLPLAAAAVLTGIVGGVEGLIDPVDVMRPSFSDAPPPALGVGGVPGPLGGLWAAAQGALLGLFSVFALAWPVQWLGRLLGGVGTYRSVVHALAWPSLASVQMTFLLFVVSSGTAWLFGGTLPGAAVALWTCLSLVLGLWLLIVNVRMLTEAHEYASWRALLTLLIVGLSYAGLYAALSVPFS